jgi:hypothetical protein
MIVAYTAGVEIVCIDCCTIREMQDSSPVYLEDIIEDEYPYCDRCGVELTEET